MQLEPNLARDEELQQECQPEKDDQGRRAHTHTEINNAGKLVTVNEEKATFLPLSSLATSLPTALTLPGGYCKGRSR